VCNDGISIHKFRESNMAGHLTAGPCPPFLSRPWCNAAFSLSFCFLDSQALRTKWLFFFNLNQEVRSSDIFQLILSSNLDEGRFR
jgi:hypothetical protein